MAFSRRDESPTSRTAGDLLLGSGAEFEGRLSFAGTVQIDSKFKGTITTDDVLVIGEHAVVEADITCGTVIIHGRVTGTIRAREAVELQASARVHADVEAQTFAIERGAVFEGSSRVVNGTEARSGAAGEKRGATDPATHAASAPPAP